MVVKTAVLKELETLYAKSGNQLCVLYGRPDLEKELLLKTFLQNKKAFYYRARYASPESQKQMMAEALEEKLQVRLQKYDYEEYFNRIKSGGPEKLILVIDEFSYIAKKDTDFINAVLKLKAKKLYPGPVMILLCSSVVSWVEKEMENCIGTDAVKKIDQTIKLSNLNFLEVVRTFPALSVSDCIRIYGTIGGVPGFMEAWNPKISYRENIYRLVLMEGGYLFHMAEQKISAELRELSVYNTILSAIAQGYNKLNDLYAKTGYSRAKISVYMKNLSHFDIVEKVQSFQTGGWENAKKGVYQIKDTFINFWFKFVFPHMSDLYLLKPHEFYDRYIAPELGTYLKRYFRNVCMEYMMLLNQMGRMPFPVHKIGTWVGKTGNIDIIAQSTDRRNIVGLCNWDQPQLTSQMCEELYQNMEKAKIRSEHIFLFSATRFEPMLAEHAKTDDRFELIDMNEL